MDTELIREMRLTIDGKPLVSRQKLGDDGAVLCVQMRQAYLDGAWTDWNYEPISSAEAAQALLNRISGETATALAKPTPTAEVTPTTTPTVAAPPRLPPTLEREAMIRKTIAADAAQRRADATHPLVTHTARASSAPAATSDNSANKAAIAASWADSVKRVTGGKASSKADNDTEAAAQPDAKTIAAGWAEAARRLSAQDKR